MLLNLAFCLSILFNIFPKVIAVNHVPALLWSTQSSMWESTPAIIDGHITSDHELRMLLQTAITREPKNVVMFLQDTLSMEDFTYFSADSGSDNPMHIIQDIMNSSPSSLVLPAVQPKTIENLPSYINSLGDWNVIQIDSGKVSHLEVERSKPNLILVTLQPIQRSNEMSAATTFSENYKQILQITKELSEGGVEYTAIYTGKRPSKVFAHVDLVPKIGRQLLATETAVPYPPLNVSDKTNPNMTNCIIIYATKIRLIANTSQEFDLTNRTFGATNVNTSLSRCFSNYSVLSLIYSSPGHDLESLEIRFMMTNKFYSGSARNWFKLESVDIIYNNKTATFVSTYGSSPAEYSYHCQKIGTSELYGETLVPDVSTPDAKNWDIFISEFQIQGFNIKDGIFSYASDCTGFFSAGIWMGLVSSLVLLWILAYGVFMIMQLTTNDKFDDPKGPALSVPQTE
ncbi:V-type proton ATPase subunit S1-like [Bombina bombina]|uniref:V-type proton ATPase subunit S1-like n=1 Tax=Bombina bombina TaxID=8345 RepID=UPI00235ABEC5|nr:V-type proton ATPase subunit S1-like [Bombina bombina]